MLISVARPAGLLLAAITALHSAPPNIVVIITDDMGFSDIAPYGGEIATPNLDKLAAGGVKFSQFCNCAKCEPSRAALLTGQQFWTKSPNVAVRKDSPNVGELLRTAGYRTLMVGKWHVADNPFERGFDRHFGFMGGGTDFFLGDDSFTLDGKPWPVTKKDFYVTTALTEQAVRFIREEKQAHPEQPFFLYLAYNAPHSPIQAPAEMVAKYRGKYLKGWDVLRRERFEKQKRLGLAGAGWNFPDRPANLPAWDSLDAKSKNFEDLRMATYAAMVDCVDQGVGAVMSTLDELKLRENTLVIFLNDNGASPNDRVRQREFGTPGTTWNVGLGWAVASTTPFKFYKRSQHGGGITMPFIAQWPAGITPRQKYEDQPCHLADVIPTLLEVAEGAYPTDFGGKRHPPLPGRSLLPILTKAETLPARTLHFSLFNNMALIHGGWKIATSYGQQWQLYDLTNDRTETRDLAADKPEKLAELLALQKAFAERPDVALRLSSGEPEPVYAPPFRPDGTKGPGIKTGRVIAAPVSQMDFNPTFLEAFGLAPIEKTHAKSLWPILSGKADTLPDRRTIMAETHNSLMSTPGKKGDGTSARAVCDGRFYYIANLIQTRTKLPEEKAINIGTGDGEYGDPGPQYAIDLHDETVRHKTDQPLPYELLRQLCMGDAPPEELYDLNVDPWAVKNLVADPAHAEILTRMRKEFADWRKATGDRDVHPKTIPRRATE